MSDEPKRQGNPDVTAPNAGQAPAHDHHQADISEGDVRRLREHADGMAKLATHLQSELDHMRRRASDLESAIGVMTPCIIQVYLERPDLGEIDRDAARGVWARLQEVMGRPVAPIPEPKTAAPRPGQDRGKCKTDGCERAPIDMTGYCGDHPNEDEVPPDPLALEALRYADSRRPADSSRAADRAPALGPPDPETCSHRWSGRDGFKRCVDCGSESLNPKHGAEPSMSLDEVQAVVTRERDAARRETEERIIRHAQRACLAIASAERNASPDDQSDPWTVAEQCAAMMPGLRNLKSTPPAADGSSAAGNEQKGKAT